MKFSDYLNEAPLLMNPENTKEWKDQWNDEVTKKDYDFAVDNIGIHKEVECDGYKVHFIKLMDDEFNVVLVDKNKQPLIGGTLMHVKDKGSAFVWVVKSKRVSSNLIIKMYLAVLDSGIPLKHTLLTDDSQSLGGKSLWKRLMRTCAMKMKYKIGIIGRDSLITEFDPKKEKFDDWYNEHQELAYKRLSQRFYIKG